MRTLPLYAVVFVSGAAVLAIEILGTRILGPFYGVSLFLWSALITATLIALSVGYAVGGRWADRGPSFGRLSGVVAAAGAWTLLIPWLRSPVLAVAEPLGLRAAVLLSACILFVPPLLLLGMVSPYAIRLRASGLGDVGRSAGDLYALSTVGSVLAALATGFFLVPQVGVRRLTLAIGVVLVLTGALAFAADRGRRPLQRAGALAAVLLVGAAAFFRALPDGVGLERGLVTVQQSPYAELRVIDDAGLRYLLVDGGIHTIVDHKTGESRHPYAQAMELAHDLFERPGDMLLVGLGGGSLARSFSRRGWRVTAVEIDPAVATIARDHFGLAPHHADVHLMDGRRFLVESEAAYDLLVIDAFGSSSIPFHLLSDEAFGLAASRLAPEGVLVLNLEVLGWDHPLVAATSATLGRHFSHLLALPVHERDGLGNLLLVASERELRPVRGRRYDFERPADRKRYVAWTRRFVPSTEGALIVTDDRSPVDLWAEEINRVARMDLHEFFRSRAPSW
jgi:spermidine synthase